MNSSHWTKRADIYREPALGYAFILCASHKLPHFILKTTLSDRCNYYTQSHHPINTHVLTSKLYPRFSLYLQLLPPRMNTAKLFYESVVKYEQGSKIRRREIGSGGCKELEPVGGAGFKAMQPVLLCRVSTRTALNWVTWLDALLLLSWDPY